MNNSFDGLETAFGTRRSLGRGLLPLDDCLREPKPLRPPKSVPSKQQKAPTFDPRLSAEASEFVPQSEASQDELASVGSDKDSKDFKDAEHFWESNVFFILQGLVKFPGRFNSLAKKLLSDVSSAGIDDTEGYSFMADAIIQTSMLEPNLRYNGARLCSVLSQKLKGSSVNTSFRYILLQKCKAEFDQRDKMILSDPSRLRGLALFLGELYIHLQAGEGAQAKRIQILQKPLLQLVDVFLTVPDAANIKCINQIMKLCGAALEDDNRAANSGKAPEMDQIISKIKTTALVATLPLASKQFLLEIVELRASNWGRGVQIPERTRSVSGASAAVESQDAFNMLDLEEAAFLESAGLEIVSDEEDNDSEFDDEMQAYYEKFLAGLD